ncbi:MAG: Fe3+/spermidine/putrescine ABC transporter ATP-binding protein [Planctomycetota bacterium]|nr:MAG: Fe3+/spermidine/putrescine ABC transporter ATP-binding protein [Planctomycetota bacterium]
MPLLKVENLSVSVGKFSIENATFEVDAGEVVVVFGPSGAGKTLLLETIAGLYKPRKGRILLDGRNITASAVQKRGFGYVPQDYALFPHLDVMGNILFGVRARGMKVTDAEVKGVVELLKIGHLLSRRVGTLSGGESQRVALARALLVRPRVLLLDEPFGALDIVLRRRLRAMLKKALQELNQAALLVTHDLEEAVVLGRRIAVMRRGKVVQFATADDVLKTPADEAVAQITGAENLLKGKVTRLEEEVMCVNCGGVEVRALRQASVGEDVALLVRAEDIVVDLRRFEESSALNQIGVDVVEIRRRGALVEVVGKSGNLTLVALVTPASAERLRLGAAREVFFSFKASGVHRVG